MRIAVDIGGTFTDLVAVDDQGRLFHSKSLTTPEDLSRAIEECFQKAEIPISDAEFFIHGSTIAINAVLERKGAPTGLLTTRGFRDVYEIGRGNRPEGYNLFFKRPVPLVPRELRLEIDERLMATGEISRPLNEDSARKAIAHLKSRGVESVAVCLLHSYANSVHEKRLGELLAEEYPEAYVTLSHEILREFREYERTSTTVLNAYIGPIVSRYLSSLERLQSNGGAMSFETAKKVPVSMMESGPVAGVIGAAAIGKAMNGRRMISFDMGGTTAKASLIKDFHPEVTTSYYIGGYVSGHPMMLPVVDIVEVGAGGGSIAWIDDAGGLKVGPQSTGAVPGPACYSPAERKGDARRGGADRQSTGAVLTGSGLGHPHDRQLQHVPGRARRLGGTGLRSTGLCPGGQRRRRSAPCRGDCAGTLGAAGRDPADAGPLLRIGHAAGGLEARLRADLPAGVNGNLPSGSRRVVRPSGAAGRGNSHAGGGQARGSFPAVFLGHALPRAGIHDLGPHLRRSEDACRHEH